MAVGELAQVTDERRAAASEHGTAAPPGPSGPTALSTTGRRQRVERRLLAVFGGLACCRVALLARSVLFADHVWFVHQLPDDAFYYLEIGRRMAAGQGPTFDGIHATNGFHPLWQLIVAGLALLFHGTALIRAVLITELALVAVGIWLGVTLIRRQFGDAAAAGAVSVAAGPLFSLFALDGMETGVTFLALMGVSWGLARYWAEPTRRTASVVGLLSGLLVLSRLDMLTVVWIVPAALAVTRRPVRDVVRATGALFATVLPYVVWNLVWFHHVLSVSGTLKLRWMSQSVATDYGSRLSTGYADYVVRQGRQSIQLLGLVTNPMSDLPGPFGLAITLLALTAAGLWLARRAHDTRTGGGRERSAQRHSPTAAALAVVAVLAVVKTAQNLVLLPRWANNRWYASPQLLLGSLLVPAAATTITLAVRRRLPAVGWAMLATLLILSAGGPRWTTSTTEQRQPGRWQDESDLAVDWIRAHGPAGTYGAYDAGLVGYELHPRTVVNLDGLVNDYRYAALTADPDRDPETVYRAEGVRYLVGRLDPPRLPSCARPLWRSSHAIAAPAGLDGPSSDVPMGVWDLAPCG